MKMFRKKSNIYIFRYAHIQNGHKIPVYAGWEFFLCFPPLSALIFIFSSVFLAVFFHVDGGETLEQSHRILANNQQIISGTETIYCIIRWILRGSTIDLSYGNGRENFPMSFHREDPLKI